MNCVIPKHLLKAFGIKLFFFTIWLGKWTPLWILHGLSTVVAHVLILIKAVPTNDIVKRNFRRAYHQELSSKEVKKLTILYYESFCDHIVEFTKRSRFSPKTMMKHCTFKNLQLLDEKFKDHRFVICYGGHMVNFEWLVSFPLWRKDYGMCHLYLAAEKNEGLDYVLRERSHFGAINIPTNSPLRTLTELNKHFEAGTSDFKGYLFGTLADMDTKKANAYSYPIFGKYNLEVTTGSERIGRQMNMAFVYAHMKRIKRGYYEIEFRDMAPTDIETNPHAYTDEFIRQLEDNILEQPELWLQWGEYRF